MDTGEYEWVSNIGEDEFFDLLRKNPRYKIGTPKATTAFTSQQLIDMGLRGLYLPQRDVRGIKDA